MFKKFIIAIIICLGITTNLMSQGTSCTNPISLILDGVLRTYPASSVLGSNVLCTSNGTTPVTWFKFTTNATAECPLLNISVSDSAACEVAFYTSCSSMMTSSSMCFYSGYGIWAPNENFLASPNTTYYLRIKTASACTIRLAGQNYTPPNGNCPGARSLSGSIMYDNNSCNHADMNVTPSQLCAFTLENTAWYQFYVASTGYSIITISDIHCDNGAANNNSGFQMGFFTGTCSSLQWINCNSGSGPTVQATTELLAAGTKVFLAVDGVSGANCSYAISGLNVLGVLSGGLKNFSGWKSAKSNVIQWTTLNETGDVYIIERSEDGIKFEDIGRIRTQLKGQQNVSYVFEDVRPVFKAFYRLKQVDMQGLYALSETININRQGMAGLSMSINNPIAQSMYIKLQTDLPGNYAFNITSIHGQAILAGNKKFEKGMNQFSIPVSNLPPGQYYINISNGMKHVNAAFIKN